MRLIPLSRGLLLTPLLFTLGSLSLPAQTTPATTTAAPAAETPAAPAGKTRVANLFGDHAVLLREEKVPVWGWDEPGQAVTVQYGEAKASAKADDNGKWMAELNLDDAPETAGELVVEGSGRVVSQDVIVGEVWLASGQSNMEWKLKSSIGVEEEVALDPVPNLRMWQAAYVASRTPKDEVNGKWEVASPETIAKFSGVGWFFAKEVSRELKVPVGLVASHWGGTPAEAWTSREGLAKLPEIDTAVTAIHARIDAHPEVLAKYSQEVVDWAKAHGREDRALPTETELAAYTEGPTDGEEWKTIVYGDKLADAGLPESGAIWFRKNLELTAEQAKWTNLNFGPFEGFDSLYVNGKLAKLTDASTGGIESRREYGLWNKFLKEGTNVLALRVFAPAKMEQFGKLEKTNEGLKGEWKAKVEFTLDPISAEALAAKPLSPQSLPKPQNVPVNLYNGMINPLVPLAIRGVIWYQGESNGGRAEQYRSVFPNLIEDWRGKWGGRNFPFYFCQLANYMAKSPQPGNSGWAETREAQAMTLKLPNTGQAILIDIGEEGDVHPRNKKDVGLRLARLALANTYGKDVVDRGPVLEKMEIKEGAAHLTFTEVAGGLKATALPANYRKKSTGTEPEIPLELPMPESEIQGFAICGADGKWVWANAKITGKNTVEVSNPEVKEPQHVRYAWANNPTCNLYNSEDLPAEPFRTDDFPLTSVEKLK